jgi:hypothetical protein
MQQGPRSVGGIGIIAHVDPGYAGRTVVGGRNGDAMQRSYSRKSLKSL